MKKYWKFTATIIVIILSIGSFYINAARSAEHFPEFVIHTISGDVQEIERLVLDGSYVDTSSQDYVSTIIKITAEGSTYNGRSFLDKIIGQPPTLIKDLQEEYRTFMRGKYSSIDQYFENQQFLAYADVSNQHGSLRSRDFKFNISLLNKNDNTNYSFTVDVPDNEKLDYIFIQDVQMVENVLYLITRNSIASPDRLFNEEHIYTIDIVNQKISNHEAIFQVAKGKSNTQTHISLIGSSPTKASQHLVFQITEEEVIEEAESTRVKDSTQKIISYNLTTKEKIDINVPDMNSEENQLSLIDDSILYFTKLDGQELIVTTYSLVDKQVGKVFKLEFSGEKGEERFPLLTVKDGKFYAATSQIKSIINTVVIVADVTTGKTLFKGQLAIKDSTQKKGSFELYLHELLVK
ncbi:hypothetical protein ACFSCX_09025 [Bacillus salitolerans]|uniref:Uncharacterized protein n=1 Tax=Bacillus salitolerans TaxID=1437434 RepID=A0ABW4LRI9_9BACI